MVMKPVSINLIKKRQTRGKLVLPLLALVICVAFGLTVVNVLDFRANARVISQYENRLRQIQQQMAQQKKKAAKQVQSQQKKQADIQAVFEPLGKMVRQELFPLLDVLTELEILKPEQVDIMGLNFADSLTTVRIKAESGSAEAVFSFIDNMARSPRFDVELSRKEIVEDSRIMFELTARWTADGNDEKI
jgi:septal ring factor EnvC (AmiA/AmiB activator)